VIGRLRRWRQTLGWTATSLLSTAAVLVVCAGTLALSTGAFGDSGGLGDLLALSQGSGQDVAQTPLISQPGPPDVATPTAPCTSGHPLTGQVDGRVPQSAIDSPQAAQGWSCNLSEVAHQGTSGGFKTWTYTDPHGHYCAYYDTALLFPLNAINLAQVKPSLGVEVLDMSDPSHPVQTDTLTSIPMLTPHESLSLNAKRGILAAVSGNPATYPGDIALYSLSQDCRHPVLTYTGVIARFGHEGAITPDGRTFWSTSSSTQSTTAIDISDLYHPHPIWQGTLVVHGLSFSDNGDIGYLQMPVESDMDIVDVSQIQNRVPNPQVKMLSRITWPESTIPQSSYPMTINGHSYLLEFDEYAFRIQGATPAPPDTVGAARIIDVADPRHPSVISNLRLAIDQPAAHAAAAQDPGALSPVQGYAGHYCGIPREVDPEIVACSFINSGLRIFNIQDPLHPKEVAYYVSPPKPADENGAQASDFAMSKPSFDPATREVFYTDGTTGFYVLKLDRSVWPDPTTAPKPPASARKQCVAPSGRIASTRLGPLALRELRTSARRAFTKYTPRTRVDVDYYCLNGGGIRAGYPSSSLLRSLTRAQRARYRNRIILELTSDRFYSLDGVKHGATIAVARRRLHPVAKYRVGVNTWYLIRGRSANGVLKVRYGRVQEIGLVDRVLTSSSARARRVFRSFG
jgi:hypothetical protein